MHLLARITQLVPRRQHTDAGTWHDTDRVEADAGKDPGVGRTEDRVGGEDDVTDVDDFTLPTDVRPDRDGLVDLDGAIRRRRLGAFEDDDGIGSEGHCGTGHDS